MRVLIGCEFSGVVRSAFRARVHKLPPSKNRWKERSRTYLGIAQAMAEQWG